ncbi:MAG: hypothetical protein HC800_25545, partial [Phormidesmis sp. RL_2_1]|nr:hypothetical protein [Phormidesmis sp. RL_2_1]
MSKTEIYKDYDAYTSHTGLTLEEQAAIEDSCRYEIPDSIDGIVIFEDGFFAPYLDKFNEGRTWICRRSGWCEHRKTGLKVRLSSEASPSFYRRS